MAFDSDYASVSLLLHGDGTTGSTTFTDNSPTPKTVTAVGNAQISTAQSKFGGASMYFDGTTDYLTSTISSPIGTADLTIEGWIRLASTSIDCEIVCIGNIAGVTQYDLVFESKTGGALRGSLQNGAASAQLDITTAGSLLSINTWHHVAFAVAGTTGRLFIDGVQGATGTVSGTRVQNRTDVRIGYLSSQSPYDRSFNGYIDDLRITKSVARYTAAFTPPTDPFGEVAGFAAAQTPLGASSALAVFGNNYFAYLSANGPLGQAQVLVEMLNEARVADPGPLGAPSVMTAALVRAFAAAPRLLGEPQVIGYLPIFASATTASPLAMPSVLAKHDFTDALGDSITRFVMDLVTPDGTVRVPISSWQATLQSGSSSYVQCVVPACLNYADAINAATEFVIYRRADVPGTALAIEYEMARSPTQQAQFDQGPQRYTCTLSGYPDAFAENLDPPAVYDRTLAGVRSISSGSKLRVRCAVDWLLRPGHRAYVDAAPLVVRYINYYALSRDSYMDVGD